MERRNNTGDFKLETVNMMKGCGVLLTQAARDINIRHVSMAETNFARWRGKSVPVWLREKGQ